MMRSRPMIPLLPSERLAALARARGMGAIAEEANVDRAGLYRSLSGEMDPAFGTVLKVLTALGIQFVAKPTAGS